MSIGKANLILANGHVPTEGRMARTNLTAARIKPATVELLTLHVLRREQVTPAMARVTLGDGDIRRFAPMGFDQWFRLFIPAEGGTLERVPAKLDTLSYLRFLTVAKAVRPAMRSYTVRAYRPDGPDGPELDVDVVLHGSDAGGHGPGMAWAQSCERGDPVALLDEGIGFNPPPGAERLLLVADESGLPATAGVLASLPRDARGHALVEVPSDDDRQELDPPPGVEVHWLARTGGDAVPGRLALHAAQELALPDEPVYGWVVGEQSLATGLRRHWVRAGVPKDHVMFCGYWKA